MQFAYLFCTDERVINAQRSFKSQREDRSKHIRFKMQSIGIVLTTEKEKNAAWRDFSSFSLQHSVIQLKYKQTNQSPNSSETSKLSEVLIRNHDEVWMILGHQSGPKFIYCHQSIMILLTLPATLESVQTSLAQIMLPGSWGDGQQRREISVWVHGLKVYHPS